MYCDVCNKEESGLRDSRLVKVQIRDGEYPGNGSTMYKDADICLHCLDKTGVKLHSHEEFDELKRKVQEHAKGRKQA